MSKKLDDIRKKIDALDNKVHDLLMERADLVVEIAKEKKKSKAQSVQPAREAAMIRRLLERHEGPLPQRAILNIWRELVGAVCMMQTGLQVAVADHEDFAACWDMAKGHFGDVLPMMKSFSPLMAMSALREDEASFAVLPWPEDELSPEADNPWWFQVFDTDGKPYMRVVAALPFGSEEENFLGLESKAMVVSKGDFMPSGKDHSILVLEVDSSVSRARIVEEMQGASMEPLAIYTKSGLAHDRPSFHLVVIDDFVEVDDKRLETVNEAFQEEQGRCQAMGGYPVPSVLRLAKVLA